MRSDDKNHLLLIRFLRTYLHKNCFFFSFKFLATSFNFLFYWGLLFFNFWCFKLACRTVLYGTACFMQLHNWYYFITGGMRSEELVQAFFSQACISLYRNSACILFISSERLGIFESNFGTLIKVAIERFSHPYAYNLKCMRMHAQIMVTH